MTYRPARVTIFFSPGSLAAAPVPDLLLDDASEPERTRPVRGVGGGDLSATFGPTRGMLGAGLPASARPARRKLGGGLPTSA